MAAYPLIELCGASLSRGETTVLHDLRFEINEGEHIAILGPNGAGKSSLSRLLTRQEYPMQRPGGEPAMIRGQERLDVFELRSHIGLVSSDLHHAFTDGHACGHITAYDVALSGFFASLGRHDHQIIDDAMKRSAMEKLAMVEWSTSQINRWIACPQGRLVVFLLLAPLPQIPVLCCF